VVLEEDLQALFSCQLGSSIVQVVLLMQLVATVLSVQEQIVEEVEVEVVEELC
jgi:hypothetical protein